MKKVILFFVIIVFGFYLSMLGNQSNDINVEDIIKKCAEAMGGLDKIKSLKTIRISVKYQGHKHINYHEVKRPNFYKMTNNKNSDAMIFDGTNACFFRHKDGKIVKEFVKKQMTHFVAEPGFSVFYFFDFPTDYNGIVKIENKNSYHLSVKMPHDVIMHYYIDCKTNLLKRTVADVMSYKGKKIKWSRDYTNYKRVAGILYPHSFTWYHNISAKTRIPKTAVISRVEFNVNYKKDHFFLPDPVQVYSKNRTSSNRMAVEKFFQKENKSDFKLSPDGKYISYIMYKNSDKKLMIQSTGEKNNHQLIYNTTDRIYKYFWVNNTQLVLSKAPVGNRKFKIYSIDIFKKKIRCLSDFSDTRSKIIFINSQNGDEIMISTNTSEVYRININTGIKQLVYRGSEKSPRIYRYYVDNSGEIRLASTHSGIQIYNSQKNDFENLMSLDYQERFVPKYFSKNNQFVYAYSSVARDKVVIVKYDLNKRKEIKILFEDPEYDLNSYEERNDSIYPTSNFYYSQEKQKLIYAYYCRDKFKKHFFDSEFKLISENIKKSIGDYPFSIESFSENSEKIIVKIFSEIIKGSFYLINRKTDNIKPIHRLNSWLNENEILSTKPISYQARDGLLIHGYITKPDGVKKKLPLFVSVHGGPTLRDTSGYNDITQLFASKGYIVFQVNYRGSQGYGQSFTKAGYKQWGRKINDDVEDGINWLIKKGWVDESKIAIYGFSSGGHAALAGIINKPDLFACSISVSGIVNLVSTFALSSKSVHFRWGDPVKDKSMLIKNSPIFNIEKIKTPLMIVNGKKDTSIPINEVDEFVKKLKLKGNIVEYLRYENDGHVMIYNNDIKRDVFEKILDFLEKHM